MDGAAVRQVFIKMLKRAISGPNDTLKRPLPNNVCWYRLFPFRAIGQAGYIAQGVVSMLFS